VSSLCPMEYDMVQGGFYQASYFWHRWPNLWNTVSGLVACMQIDNIIYSKARIELVFGFF
jgi:hypothetical protein